MSTTPAKRGFWHAVKSALIGFDGDLTEQNLKLLVENQSLDNRLQDAKQRIATLESQIRADTVHLDYAEKTIVTLTNQSSAWRRRHEEADRLLRVRWENAAMWQREARIRRAPTDGEIAAMNATNNASQVLYGFYRTPDGMRCCPISESSASEAMPQQDAVSLPKETQPFDIGSDPRGPIKGFCTYDDGRVEPIYRE